MPTFRIKEIFRITGQGYVLSGCITDTGFILTGDKVLVVVQSELVVIRITGISIEKEEKHFGLLISFKSYESLKHKDLKGKEIKILNIKERQKLAVGPIEWTGDLSDDCTATWAGLMLRAEWMDEDYWWWSVYDMLNDEVTIDSSNNYKTKFIGGETSRRKAEEVAKKYLSIV